MEKPIVDLRIDMVATVFKHIVAQISDLVDQLDVSDRGGRKHLLRNLYQLCLLEETYCVTIGDDEWFMDEQLAKRVEAYLKERGSSWNDVRTKAGVL